MVGGDDPAATARSPVRIYRENVLPNVKAWRPVDPIVPLKAFPTSNREFDLFEDWPRTGEQPGVTRKLVSQIPGC